jgi:hypothetical protein
MPFTRVPSQSNKREESNGLFLSSQQQKNSKKKKRPQNIKHKVLVSQKEGCQRSMRRSIESQRISASEKQRLDLRKCNSGKDFLQTEAGALV